MTGNLRCAAIVLLAVTSLNASDSLWTGRWKYKRDKSTFTNFAIWDLGNGSYRYGSQHGRTIMFYQFTCDGKPSGPLPKFYPFSCTGDPVHGWDFVQWMANAPMGHSRRTLSADGKTLTVGPPFDFNFDELTSPKTYVRIAGSTGFAGSWQDKNELPEAERDEIISITGDTYHEEYPGGTRLALNAKLDGTPVPMPGDSSREPPVSALTISVKMETPNTIRFQWRVFTSTINEGIETLSADGKTITFETWAVSRSGRGNPDTKTLTRRINVFEKQ